MGANNANPWGNSMRRRAIPALAAALLAAGCSSAAAQHAASPPPTQTTTHSTATARPISTPASNTRVTAIRAAQLPYQPAPGMPALDDVTYTRTPTTPCGIPADDSGNEAQLLNAQMDVNVLIVTFEFTNPCPKPLTYNFTVTEAIGSAHGPSAGPGDQQDTQTIQPGQSATLQDNVDPDPNLTQAQLQQLWVGVTRLSVKPAP